MSSVEKLLLNEKTCIGEEDSRYFSLAFPEYDNLSFANHLLDEHIYPRAKESEKKINLYLFNNFSNYCFPELTSNASYNYEFKQLWNVIYRKYFERFSLNTAKQTELSLVYRRFHDLLVHVLDVDFPIAAGTSPSISGLDLMNSNSAYFRAMFLHLQVMTSAEYRRFIQTILYEKLNALYYSVPPKYAYCNSVMYLCDVYSNLYDANFEADYQTTLFNLPQELLDQARGSDEYNSLIDYLENETSYYAHPAYGFIDKNSGLLAEFDVSTPERLQDNDLILFNYPGIIPEEPLLPDAEANLYLGRYRSANDHVYFYPATDFGITIPVRNLYVTDSVRSTFRPHIS